MIPWVLGAVVASSALSPASAQSLAPEDPVGGPYVPEPPPSRRVRLSGRLVADQLDWAWVRAVRRPPRQEVAPELADDIVEAEEGALELELSRDASGAPTIPGDLSLLDGVPAVAYGRPWSTWAVPPGATRVGPDGAFSLDLAPGSYQLLAGARGCPTRFERCVLDGDRMVEWALAFTPPAVLTVRCVGSAGQPLALGRLRACFAARLDAWPVDLVGTRPRSADLDPSVPIDQAFLGRLDEAGEARLFLPPGRWTLGDSGPFAAPAEGSTSWVEGGATPLGVVLGPGEERTVTLRQEVEGAGRVRVTVRDRDGALPGAQVRLVAVHPGTLTAELGPGLHARADARGQVTWSDVPPGDWFALAQDGEVLGQTHMPARLAPGGTLDLTIVLNERQYGGFVPTVVDDEWGEPLQAIVDVLSPWGERSLRPPVGLVPGRYLVRVTCWGYPTTLVTVEVAAGEPRPLEVRLRRGEPISGRVAGFGPAPRVSLQATPTGPSLDPLYPEEKTDPGSFCFHDGAPAGCEAWLRIEAAGCFPYHQRVRAPAEGLTVHAPARPVATVEVRAVQTGELQADQEVELCDGQGRTLAVGRTDAEGRVRLLEAPPAGARVRCKLDAGLTLLDPSGVTVLRVGDEWGDQWGEAR